MTAGRGNPAAAKIHWMYWLSLLFLLSAMQAFGFIDRLVYGSWDGKTGDKITALLNLLMIASSLALFIYRCKRTRTIGTGGIIALATVGFLFLDSLWSIDPAATIRQAIIYLYVVLGSIGVAGLLSPDEFMDALGLGCFLSALASLALLVVAHGTAVSELGDYIGIFSHKNFLGQVMATGALASLHGIQATRHHRVRNICFLLVFAGMAFASKSASSWLTIFVFCALAGIIALWRRGGAAKTIGVVVAAVALPTLVFAAIDPDAILVLIGKDPSLTGRTEIWAFVINDIWQRPILGWGYFAFWSPFNLAAVEISDTVHWMVPQAHNGLLEMLLTIGFVGTGIFVFLLLRSLALAVQCFRTREQALGLSTILCCAGIVLVGVSETVLLASTQPSTSVFFITGLMCDRVVRAARLQRWPVTHTRHLATLPASRA